MFTYAVVGQNERARLGEALRQAREAARPGDEVWFVDSGSDDGSPEVAESLGARVLRAPGKKGRAIAHALAEASTEYVAFLDADIDRTTSNIAIELRAAVERSGADLVVAEFDEPRLQVRDSSRYVWRPLVAELLPEAHERFGRTPLSGFRALRAGMDLGRLPPGFGVETHVNLAVTLNGGSFELVDVGTYWGPVRSKPLLGREVGAAILDIAEANGRLDPAARPLWDAWVEGIVEVVVQRSTHASSGHTPSENVAAPDYVGRMEAAASRPLPPAGGRSIRV
jgi:glucosyl-3-phosphoglycerate synthase